MRGGARESLLRRDSHEGMTLVWSSSATAPKTRGARSRSVEADPSRDGDGLARGLLLRTNSRLQFDDVAEPGPADAVETDARSEGGCSWRLRISRASIPPIFNVVCMMAGTGILQLPYTLQQGGWLTILVLLVVALVTNFTGKSLVASLYIEEHRLYELQRGRVGSEDDEASETGSAVSGPAFPRPLPARLPAVTPARRPPNGRSSVNSDGESDGDGTILSGMEPPSPTLTVTSPIVVDSIDDLVVTPLPKKAGLPRLRMATPVRNPSDPVRWKRLNSYPAIGAAAFGDVGFAIVQIFHKCTILGVGTLFLILGGTFSRDIAHVLHSTAVSDTLWIWIVAGAASLPVVFLRTMKEISITSFVGMGASIAIVATVIILGIIQGPTGGGGTPEALPHDHTAVNWALFPSAFSAIVLSFGGHAVFPSVEEHAPKRDEFAGVLNWSFLALVVLYLPTAAVGYALFGASTRSPVLDNFAADGVIPIVTKSIITVHVLMTFPILMNVIARELEHRMGVEALAPADGSFSMSEFLPRTLLRLVIVAVAAAMAASIPFFSSFMTLVGAVCITMMVFVLPSALSLRLRGHRMAWPEIAGCVFAILLGLGGGIIGSIQATHDIARKLAGE